MTERSISKPTGNVVEIGSAVTTVVLKADVLELSIQDEGSRRTYKIRRSPKKSGLQLTGNY